MCVCGCLLLYDTMSSPRPPAVSPKGREKAAAAAAVYILVCESMCVWCVFAAPHAAKSQTQAGLLFFLFFQQRSGRRAKQIKHKLTNHRRRLISAVLKGEPGMSDDPPYEFLCDAAPYATMKSHREQRG